MLSTGFEILVCAGQGHGCQHHLGAVVVVCALDDFGKVGGVVLFSPVDALELVRCVGDGYLGIWSVDVLLCW
jgi:hypothetical protein